MSILLDNILNRETVLWESKISRSGQGKVSFNSPVDLEVVARRQDEEVLNRDGVRVLTDLALWIPSDVVTIPGEGDRIEYESELFIVIVVKRVQRFTGAINHHRLLCRREGS